MGTDVKGPRLPIMSQELCPEALGGDRASIQIQPCHALLPDLRAHSRHSSLWSPADACPSGAPACAAHRSAANLSSAFTQRVTRQTD